MGGSHRAKCTLAEALLTMAVPQHAAHSERRQRQRSFAAPLNCISLPIERQPSRLSMPRVPPSSSAQNRHLQLDAYL